MPLPDNFIDPFAPTKAEKTYFKTDAGELFEFIDPFDDTQEMATDELAPPSLPEHPAPEREPYFDAVSTFAGTGTHPVGRTLPQKDQVTVPERSFPSEVVAGVARGAANIPGMVGGGLELVGSMTGLKPVSDAGKSMEEWSKKTIADDPASYAPSEELTRQEWYEPRRFLATAAEAAPFSMLTMGGMTATNIATKLLLPNLPRIGSIITYGVGGLPFGLASGGQMRKQIMEKGFDETTANRYGLLAGVAEGVLEFIGAKPFMKALNIDELTVPAIEKALLSTATAKQIAKQAVPEGIEELLQSLKDNIIMRKFDPGQKISEGALESFVQGIFMGAYTGAAMEAGRHGFAALRKGQTLPVNEPVVDITGNEALSTLPIRGKKKEEPIKETTIDILNPEATQAQETTLPERKDELPLQPTKENQPETKTAIPDILPQAATMPEATAKTNYDAPFIDRPITSIHNEWDDRYNAMEKENEPILAQIKELSEQKKQTKDRKGKKDIQAQIDTLKSQVELKKNELESDYLRRQELLRNNIQGIVADIATSDEEKETLIDDVMQTVSDVRYLENHPQWQTVTPRELLYELMAEPKPEVTLPKKEIAEVATLPENKPEEAPLPSEDVKRVIEPSLPTLQGGKAAEIADKANEAATSPENTIPEPTEAQKTAGNYKKGHINLHGFDISIENPKGSVRTGTSPEGKEWKSELKSHYGYIKGVKGADKDHLDVFIGPNPESESVFVVNQVNPKTGKFDEHKVMMGFNSEEEARAGYLENYEAGWQGLKSVNPMSIQQFKDWTKSGKVSAPATLPDMTVDNVRETLPSMKQLDAANAEAPNLRTPAPERFAVTGTGIPMQKPRVKAIEPPESMPVDIPEKYRSIYLKKAKELTEEEIAMIFEPNSTPMDKRNRELAGYERDPRFHRPVRKDERGYQPSWPEDKQPVKTDKRLVLDYLKHGTLTEKGKEIDDVGKMYIAYGIDPLPAYRNADILLHSIKTGTYSDLLHPDNKISRKIFAKLTGIQLPAGVSKTKALFKGIPFDQENELAEKTAEIYRIEAELLNEGKTIDPELLRKPEQQEEQGDVSYQIAQPFYSQLERTVEEFKQNKFTGVQAKNMLVGKVKADELADIGLDEFLSGKKTVTKQELLDYIRKNKVEVQRVTKGAFNNPEEILLEVRRKLPDLFDKIERAGLDVKVSFNGSDIQFPLKIGTEIKAFYGQSVKDAARKIEREYLSLRKTTMTHFDDARYRLPGGDEGTYREEFLTLPNYDKYKRFTPEEKELRELNAKTWQNNYEWSPEEKARAEYLQNKVGVSLIGKSLKRWEDGHSAYSDITNPIVRIRYDERTIPDGTKVGTVYEFQPPSTVNQAKMPEWARKRWREIGAKHMLRIAAEKGWSKLTWVTGEQVAGLYDLSKHVDSVAWTSWPALGKGKGILVAYKNEEEVIKENIYESELPDYIGKEIAERLMNQPIEQLTGRRVLEGEMLSVGGVGIKRLYDQDMVNVFNKLGKPFGVKAEEINIPGEYTVHSISITPELAQSAVAVGQPLFQSGKSPINFRITPEQMAGIVQETARIAAPGSKVKFSNMIAEQNKAALSKWGKGDLSATIRIKGSHRTIQVNGHQLASLIELSLSDMDETTPYHEAFHSVQELLLNAKEKALLESRFPDKAGVSSKERQAEAFAKWVQGEKQMLGNSIKSIFQKIRDFFSRIKNALNGMGFQIAEDIFRKAYTGEYAKRYVSGKGDVSFQIGKEKSRELALRILKEGEVFGKYLDAWSEGKIKDTPLIVSSTPEILQKLGARPLRIIISNAVLRKSLYPKDIEGGKHHIPIDTLKQLPLQIHSPIMVFESNEYPGERLVIMTELQHSGKTIIVAVHLSTQFKNHIVNNIVTVHGKLADSWFWNNLKTGRLLYADKDKSLEWVRSRGFIETSKEAALTTQGFNKNLDWQRFLELATASKKMPSEAINNNILTDEDIVKPDFSETDVSFQVTNPVTDSQDNPEQFQQAIRNSIADMFKSHKVFNWWHKTVGTQYHKAQIDPDFKKVFDKGQEFLSDFSRIALDAEAQAPKLLTKVSSFRDLANLGIGKKTSAKLGTAVFTGTLEDTVYDDETLSNRFKLAPEEIEYYREYLNSINQSVEDLAKSTIARLAKTIGIDMEWSKQLRTLPLNEFMKELYEDALKPVRDDMKADIQELEERLDFLNDETLKDEELAAEIKFAQGELDRLREQWKPLNKAISNMFRTKARANKLKREGYAPLMRFGQHSVYVYKLSAMPGEAPEQIYFGLYESSFEANRAARQLANEYPDAIVKQGILSKEAYKLFNGLTPDVIELFADVTGLDKDPLFQDYLRMAVNNRSAMKRLMHRRGVAGFSEDPTRTLSAFITSNARLASTNYNMGDMRAAVQRISKGDVKDEAFKLMEYLQNPREEASKFRGFLFFNYLGGSLAAGIVNATQPILMTAPYLAQHANASTVTSQMITAAKEAVTHNFGDDVKAALQNAEAEGLTSPHEIYQLMAEARVGMNKRILWRNMMKMWGSFFGFAEQFNRQTTFIAAYRIAKSKGMNPVKSYDFAKKAVEETQGIYNKGNRPNWARGAIGASVMTFKQYSISYLEFLKRLPRKQLMIAAGILMAAAGLQGMPFREDIEDLLDTIGQWLGYPTNTDKSFKRAVLNAFGEDIGRFILFGASALPGVPLDIQGRLGLQNLIPGTAMLKPSERNRIREAGEMLGPVGGVVQSGAQMLENLVKGRHGEAVTVILPKAVRDAVKGMEMWNTGKYTDTSGRIIDKNVTAGEAITKAVGFHPERLAKMQRTISTNMDDIAIQRTKESEFAGRIASAVNDKDSAEVRRIRQEQREWNADNPDYKIFITPAQIRQRVRELRMTREERLIKSTPKELRGQVKRELQIESLQ